MIQNRLSSKYDEEQYNNMYGPMIVVPVPTLSLSPLLSVSGVVVEVSPQAEARAGLKKGDKVMALLGGGGYAGK